LSKLLKNPGSIILVNCVVVVGMQFVQGVVISFQNECTLII